MTDTPVDTVKPPLHLRQAEGLRALADFIEANPSLAEEMAYTLSSMQDPVLKDDPVETLAEFARAAARARIPHRKNGSDKYFRLELQFGDAVTFTPYASREKVCERVVVGTTPVTKTVPDPEALAAVPTIEVTEDVEQVEWVCRPLLADTAEPAVA